MPFRGFDPHENGDPLGDFVGFSTTEVASSFAAAHHVASLYNDELYKVCINSFAFIYPFVFFFFFWCVWGMGACELASCASCLLQENEQNSSTCRTVDMQPDGSASFFCSVRVCVTHHSFMIFTSVLIVHDGN